MPMTFADLEAFYELLAESIDEAGEDKAPLFLAKLALLLAKEISDPEQARKAVRTALADL